jgi:hypothetical protein
VSETRLPSTCGKGRSAQEDFSVGAQRKKRSGYAMQIVEFIEAGTVFGLILELEKKKKSRKEVSKRFK